MQPPLEDFLLGYLPLSTSTLPSFPGMAKVEGHQNWHSTVFRARSSATRKLFAPARGREYNLFTTIDPNDESVFSAIANALSNVDLDSLDGSVADRMKQVFNSTPEHRGLSVVVQRTPHVMLCVSARKVWCYLYGLSCEHNDLLGVSNLEPSSFADLLRMHTENRYYVYRFNPFKNGQVVLFPSRLSVRWNRWKADSRMTPLHRFAALEQLLFKGSADI